MGGNVFKGRSRRIGGQEHRFVGQHVCGEIRTRGEVAETIPSVRSKESFGDVDILTTANAATLGEIFAGVGEGDRVRNGECLSVLQEGVQVDLVTVETSLFQMGMAYFSWNDLGNLMGRTARRTGFRYGHRGLFLHVGGSGLAGISEKVTVCSEPAEIFSFLGYDYRRWEDGFDSAEDMYTFAASTPFFTPESFQLYNLDHATRTRNRKRKSYAGFLEWMRGRSDPAFDFEAVGPKFWEDRALAHFGNSWLEKKRELLGMAETRKLVSSNFNGRVIGESTGLQGQELGAFMKAFRASVGEDFAMWAAGSTRAEVIAKAKEFRKRDTGRTGP